jgi:uncharacterized protein (TIGR03435 family)
MKHSALAALWLTGWISIVQAQTPSEFEVASVKQLDQIIEPGRTDLSFVGTSGKPFKVSGNRVTLRCTVRTLIEGAYDIKDYQVLAVPPWADSLIYAITAKTPGDAVPTAEQIRPMLQALLADRFQLKFHRDTKTLPVYHLMPGTKNMGLKEAAPEETFHWDITTGPNGTMRSKATKESIGDFVQLVGVSADRPVINKTGLTGDIDYDILISQDARTQDDVNRAILAAVKDQLGLKLDPAKDPIEVLVVDHVEKPSAN